MKSITKYISLLAIAMLAISALGTASAAHEKNIIVDKEINYEFTAGNKPKNYAIGTETYNNLKALFNKEKLNITEYLSISNEDGIRFIDEVLKGGIALKSDKIVGEPVYNNATDKIDVHIERLSLIIWN
ncbi:MAG: conserved hypothetical protein [Methanobrevibacter sp. CfCl-M3]